MPDRVQCDLLVVGGGPAGLAAAIEAARNGVEKILLVERGKELGGILQQCIHNGFGLHEFQRELTGPEYAQRFISEFYQIKSIDCKCNTTLLSIDAATSEPAAAGAVKPQIAKAINEQDGYFSIEARAIILAMGCRERTRGAIAIPGTRPAGVFTAGAAQQYINMEGYMVGKRAVILGSGDIGLIMARRLTLEGATVEAVVELLPFANGLRRNVVQCLEDYQIPLLLSHTVSEIRGKGRVEGVRVVEVDEKSRPIPNTQRFLDCDTLLLSVGLIPENELSRKAGIIIDRGSSGPLVNEQLESSVAGVFACGNVLHVHDLVDFVSEEARKAALAAARFLKQPWVAGAKSVPIRAGHGIRYTVPQKLSAENLPEHVDIFMRVKEIYQQAQIQVHAGGTLLASFAKRHMAPGEMQKIRISQKVLQQIQSSALEVSVSAVAE